MLQRLAIGSPIPALSERPCPAQVLRSRHTRACIVTVGELQYYFGRCYGPNAVTTIATPFSSGNTNTKAVEVLTGGVSPKGAPTVCISSELWSTEKALPLSGMKDLGLSRIGCTNTSGSFYYHVRGNSPFGPFPSTSDMMTYTTTPAARLKHEMYSPLTDSWTTKANVPIGYVGGAIGVWEPSPSAGTILVAGGYPAVVTMHLYNAAQGAWREGTAARTRPPAK
jgi:hypothetical protein